MDPGGSRRDRIREATRAAQELSLRDRAIEVEQAHVLAEHEAAGRAAVRDLRELIKTFLRVMGAAGNPGLESGRWPIATSLKFYARATLPGFTVALDRRGRVMYTGRLEPQSPDVSGRGHPISAEELRDRRFAPIGVPTHADEAFFISEAFEQTIGWYVDRFPELRWPGLEVPPD